MAAPPKDKLCVPNGQVLWDALCSMPRVPAPRAAPTGPPRRVLPVRIKLSPSAWLDRLHSRGLTVVSNDGAKGAESATRALIQHISSDYAQVYDDPAQAVQFLLKQPEGNLRPPGPAEIDDPMLRELARIVRLVNTPAQMKFDVIFVRPEGGTMRCDRINAWGQVVSMDAPGTLIPPSGAQPFSNKQVPSTEAPERAYLYGVAMDPQGKFGAIVMDAFQTVTS